MKLFPGAFRVSETTLPFHQGKVVFPGLSQPAFPMALGSLRFVTTLDSIKSPMRSLISSTRQGLLCGNFAFTLTDFCPGQGDKIVFSVPFSFVKYIPA